MAKSRTARDRSGKTGSRNSKRTTSRAKGGAHGGGRNADGPISAESLASRQREISVSEFFAKNRHLLGFDNPRKAVLTTVKEAVDNALDACEEAGILPDLHVEIEHLSDIDEGRYRITVQDNGPGIVRKQIDNIFGKLLYGSKFHRLKMSRGQQGIGISAAGMYGLMTTGKPMIIVTRPGKRKRAHHVELAMDTRKNRPVVSMDVETDEFPPGTGTRVTIELEGKYSRGRTSVDEYLEQTAIANPHAKITYRPPVKDAGEDGESLLENGEESTNEIDALTHTGKVGAVTVFPRGVDELPPEPEEIKPHPRGVELGTLMQMLKHTEHKHLGGFLTSEFSRISQAVSKKLVEKAGLTTRTWTSAVNHAEAEALFKSMQTTKFMAPPMNCLAPIGTKQILAGLLKGVKAEFYTASTRPAAVYRGNPFQIEVGMAFGGDLPGDQLARVIRFANRVPLLYQQSACALYKAVIETNWRNYGVSQSRGALPEAPLIVMIHMASVWVPFTSESKEAIADYDEIRKEMRLALQECGRKLATYVRKRQRIKREGQRRDIFERYIGEVARALHVIDSSIDPAEVRDHLERVARSRTAIADEETDENALQDADPFRAFAKDEDTVVLDVSGDGGGGGATEAAISDGDQSSTGKKKRSRKKRRRKGARSNGRKRSDGGGDGEQLFE